ncbi:hypothetical protein ABS858_04645 [Vibrio neptunius]|uniref:hypothetical protein n=1 Tax=Vibrio neptunius TaxID=170651 RepID=UPI003315361D
MSQVTKLVLWVVLGGAIIGNFLRLKEPEKAVVSEIYKSVAPKSAARVTGSIDLVLSSGEVISIFNCAVARAKLQEAYLSRSPYKLHDAEWDERVARSWDAWSQACGTYL